MRTLWQQFPDYHPFSIAWRMGDGEDYKSQFWDWWDAAAENKDTDARLKFVKASEPPAEWTHVALSMVWPERLPGDEFEFFFNDNFKQLRSALFVYGQDYGFASEDDWVTALAKSLPD